MFLKALPLLLRAFLPSSVPSIVGYAAGVVCLLGGGVFMLRYYHLEATFVRLVRHPAMCG